jgi:hypothetical protein
MRFEFYEGIDGETLRIESESRGELTSLLRLFDDLEADRLQSAELTQMFGGGSSAVKQILLRRVARRHFETAEVMTQTSGIFDWQADALDLARYSGLVSGLLDAEPRRGAYQLLTSPQPEAITVEVTTTAT